LVVVQRAFAVSSAGIEGSKSLAESARDLERTRKAIAVQLVEFEGSKRNLMRDLQNRCEKVCNSLPLLLSIPSWTRPLGSTLVECLVPDLD
jgi:hypothetical protein